MHDINGSTKLAWFCTTAIACGAFAFFATQALAHQPPARIPIYLNWDANCLTLSPEGIAALAADAKWAGIDGLNLRISNKGALNFRTRVGTPYSERLDAFGPGYDPLAILIRECREQGIAATVWVDLFEAAYDCLIEANPQFTPQGRPGKPALSGFPCYAHEEVRRHMLALVDEYASYRPDMVFFCTKSSHIPKNHRDRPHNRASGFNPPVVEKYRELHGVDIRTEPFDPVKMGRIRGEFLIDFLCEAHKRLDHAGIKMLSGATTTGRLQPAGPYLLLDWRRMLKCEAADALVMSNSRGEYHVFYNDKGQKLFGEIRAECEKAGVALFPYIISSGTHGPIAKKFGFAGLLDYLPRQIAYLHALGGQGIVIHDLDLYTFDRGMRRALWRAAGKGSNLTPEVKLGATPPLPTPRALEDRFPGRVPQGRFEESDASFWYAVSSWQNEPGSPATNGSFEGHVDGRSKPRGWTSDTGDNEKLAAVYDWKVMHDDPYSGRTFHGRSSVLLVAKPGAPAGNSSTASWSARIPVPEGSLGPQTIRIHAHGETLREIASAGMIVDVLDGDGKRLDTLRAPCPVEGTFSWTPLSVTCDFDGQARSLDVQLYLKTSQQKDAQARLWFDRLEIGPPAVEPCSALEHHRGPGAYRGTGYVRFATPGGLDMVSVPFRAETTEQTVLRLAMRSDQPLRLRVVWDGRVRREVICHVTPQWGEHELPIAQQGTHPRARVEIRPLERGILWVDHVELAEKPAGGQ